MCPHEGETEVCLTQREKVMCDGNRKRFEDTILLALKMKDGALSQDMQFQKLKWQGNRSCSRAQPS